MVAQFGHNDQWHSWFTPVLITLDELMGPTAVVWAEIRQLLTRYYLSLLKTVNSLHDAPILLLLRIGPASASIFTGLKKYPHKDAGDASPAVLSKRVSKVKIFTTDGREFPFNLSFRNESLLLTPPRFLTHVLRLS